MYRIFIIAIIQLCIISFSLSAQEKKSTQTTQPDTITQPNGSVNGSTPASQAENAAGEKQSEGTNKKILSKPKHETPGTFTVGEIVVRDRAIASIEEASTTTEITAEDIEAHGDKLLADSLRMVPGLQIVERKKGNQEFEVRGFSMDRIAVLIDGIPITDAYGGNMDINNIGVEHLSKIIVTRGASSALYGTRGAVGTINMVTQKPDKLYGKVSAEYGLYNNIFVNLSQGAPIGKFYYWITGTFDKSDGYQASRALDSSERLKWIKKLTRYDKFPVPSSSPARNFDLSDFADNKALQCYLNDDSLVDHISHMKYKISGKMGYEIVKGVEIGVSAFYNNTEKKGSTYQTNWYSSWVPSTGTWSQPMQSDFFSNMSNNWVEYYNYNISPYLYAEWKDLSIKINGYYYEQSNTLEGFKDPLEITYAWNMFQTTAYWSIWTSHSYGFNIYPSYKICSWNKLNAAISFRMDDHLKEEKPQRQATALIDDYGRKKYKTQFIESLNLTVALEDEFNIYDRTRITVGLSYDMQDLTRFQKKIDIDGRRKMVDQYIAKDDSILGGTRDFFSPVFGISGDPVKDLLTLRGALSYKAHFPNLEQYSKTVESKDAVNEKISLDTLIKAEKSLNASAGFEFSFLKKTLSLRADYYFSKYDDKIESIYDSNTGDKQYFNVDSALIQGIEASIGGIFKDVGGIVDISFSIAYTFIDKRNQTDVEDTDLNKGDRFEYTPEHQIGLDVRTAFITGTSFNLWLSSSIDQIKYVMKTVPAAHDSFSTDYYLEQRLHDPVFLNIKISQNITEHFTIYVKGLNLLDDYNADPLNPGPGCMFYWGVSAQI
ncbi:MAG TPA: TonB-dependent receptor plug domain-containing protein [Spirochaetota bacterium]|nr:TonB-dependent receptor plug domain-containing protein [Spirochaetota bacterium]HPI90908.1 TonB-dependent receptor plug domain-containing protein [Spirochaetota bacterium]HPR50009.1 TonB-dependent receptor plug domain-containing protein [Spirochaetota bacterium]